MKHGPIALIDAQVQVVSIALPGTVFDKVLSNAQEANAGYAQLIGVAPAGPVTELFDVLLPRRGQPQGRRRLTRAFLLYPLFVSPSLHDCSGHRRLRFYWLSPQPPVTEAGHPSGGV